MQSDVCVGPMRPETRFFYYVSVDRSNNCLELFSIYKCDTYGKLDGT